MQRLLIAEASAIAIFGRKTVVFVTYNYIPSLLIRMIRWRLRVLMAEKNLMSKTLAEQTGIHATTISRFRNTDELK